MTCAELDCGGTVVDGYCDVCGTAPAAGQPSSELTATAAMATTARSRRSARTSTRAGARGRLGAGIVTIPPVTKGNPIKAILTDPEAPESHRFCGSSQCGKPVGRTRDGSPGRAEGFCSSCGTPYSFIPRLSRGDLVGGQYEVRGCLAHGDLGWIYLAVLLAAGARASALSIESTTKRETLRLNVLSAALGWLEAGHTPKVARLLGCDLDVRGIRIGMERCYRALARETTEVWERIDLVEKANAVRPRTRV